MKQLHMGSDNADVSNTYRSSVQRLLMAISSIDRIEADGVSGYLRHSGIPSSSGYRLLRNLEAAGYMERGANGRLSIGQEGLRIGLIACGFGGIYPVVWSLLQGLRDAAKASAAIMFAHKDSFRLMTGPVLQHSRLAFGSRELVATEVLEIYEGKVTVLKDAANPGVSERYYVSKAHVSATGWLLRFCLRIEPGKELPSGAYASICEPALSTVGERLPNAQDHTR